MGSSDAQDELQTGGTPCIACLGSHRRHTCALRKSGLMLTAPAEPTSQPCSHAVQGEHGATSARAAAPALANEALSSTVRAVGPTADANGGTESDAAAVAAAAVTAEGAATEPTRVSHRKSAPPLRLVEDGAGRQASAPTRRKPAATAHDAAAPAVSAGTPLSAGAPRPLDDGNAAPVLWVGDSTFVRLTKCDAWGALQMGDLRSEIKSVNGEKPSELLRRIDKLADTHPHARALVLCTVRG
jgi:hypothetical protein